MLGGVRAKATISLPSALKEKQHDSSRCLQQNFTLPPPRATATCGVNHASVSRLLNVAYKSSYVNALSALRNSSVDTFRFTSCSKGSGWRRLNSSRRYLRCHAIERMGRIGAPWWSAKCYGAGLFLDCCLPRVHVVASRRKELGGASFQRGKVTDFISVARFLFPPKEKSKFRIQNSKKCNQSLAPTQMLHRPTDDLHFFPSQVRAKADVR
jgi:hypothetical protein